MKRYFTAAVFNLLAGIISIILFLFVGRLTYIFGAGAPKWLYFVPSLFFICSVFNFISLGMNVKLNRKGSHGG